MLIWENGDVMPRRCQNPHFLDILPFYTPELLVVINYDAFAVLIVCIALQKNAYVCRRVFFCKVTLPPTGLACIIKHFQPFFSFSIFSTSLLCKLTLSLLKPHPLLTVYCRCIEPSPALRFFLFSFQLQFDNLFHLDVHHNAKDMIFHNFHFIVNLIFNYT